MKEKDPLDTTRERLFDGGFTPDELSALDVKIAAQVDDAVAFAESSPENDLRRNEEHGIYLCLPHSVRLVCSPVLRRSVLHIILNAAPKVKVTAAESEKVSFEVESEDCGNHLQKGEKIYSVKLLKPLLTVGKVIPHNLPLHCPRMYAERG